MSLPSPFILIPTLLLPLLTSIIIYRLYFHPLSRLPGPPLARISTLYLAYHVRAGTNHTFFPSLHARYGPLVRIAPSQVLACSEDAIRAAYSATTSFTKGSWYQVAAAPDKQRRGDDHLDLLTEMNMEKYRRQRRAIGPAYSIKGMEKHEGLLDGFLGRFVERLRSLEGKRVDVAEWAHIYVLDALGVFTLGRSPGYTERGDDGGNLAAGPAIWACFTTIGLFPTFVRFMHGIPKVGPLFMLPACLALGLRLPKMWTIFEFCVPGIMERLKELDSTADVKLMADRPGVKVSHGYNVKAKPKDEEYDVGKEKDLLATLMKLHHDKEARFRPSWVMGIALTNFGAGHETMMLTLAGCIYYIFTHPSILQRLRNEMKEQGVTKDSGYTDMVNKVPLFLAIIKEATRMWPVIGFFLPRVVPASGATISNTYLPPGTTMGISLWATHYDPALFPHPETFDPDRWLPDGTEAKKKEIGRMDALWMGFGGQSRSCPGQYLARFFIVKLLAQLVLHFDIEVTGTPKFLAWFGVGLEGVNMRVRERA